MRVEDRIRRELRAQGARLGVPAADLERVRRRGRIIRRRRMSVAVGVAAAAVVAAVGATGAVLSRSDNVGPVANGDTPTTESVTTVTQPPTTPESTTTTAPTTSVPAAGERAATMTIASRDGIVTMRDDEVVDRIDVGPIMTAISDHRDGFVVQIGVSASTILHVDAAGEMSELVAPDGTETLTLHDVAMIDGSPTVVYTERLSGVSPEQAREDLRLFDLVTGQDRFVVQMGGYESGASQITYGTDLFVVTMNAEGYTWFEGYDLAGTAVEFPGNPRTESDSAEDFLVWVGAGALAPDGSTFAFLEGSPRSEAPFQFVVVDLPTGQRIVEVAVEGAREGTVRRLDWDGTTAVVSIADAPAIVIRDQAVVGTLAVPGIADLAGTSTG